MRLVVRVTPRAGRDGLDGWGRDAQGRPFLKLRVAAAPADGAANEAVRRLVASALGLRVSAVTLASGAAARIKTLEVEADEEAALRRLGLN